MATAEPTEKDFSDALDLGSDLARCICGSSGSGSGRFRLLEYLGVACGVQMLNMEASDPSTPEDDDDPP